MHFNSLSEFIAMGGYGFYVWLSYGVTFSLLIGLTVISVRQRRKLINQIRARQLRQQKLKQYRKGKA